MRRLDFIEGLRGLAVGIVMVFHASAWAGVLTGRAATVFSYGRVGVDLFFVISGFCMVWPILRAGRLVQLDAARFLLRRFLRIAPPYYAAMALVFVTSWLMWRLGGPSYWSEPMQNIYPAGAGLAGDVATHLTFTHGFFQQYDHSLDGAFWSLSTEWQFYVALPLLVVLARRIGLVAVGALAAVASATYVVVVHEAFNGFLRTTVGGDVIGFRLVEFGAGMAAAALVGGRRRPWLVPAVATALVVALAVQYRGPFAVVPFAWALAGGGLVLACSAVPAWARVAEWPPLRALGRVSYSAYLTHGSVFMALAVPLTAWDASRPVRLAVLFAVGLPAAVAVAVVLHRTIETRAVGWSHRVRARRRPALAR